MADPIGTAFSQWMGIIPNFLGDIPRGFYTVTGALIVTTDRFSVVNSAVAIALTLPDGIRDGQPLIIKNIGAGALTLTATIDGTAGTTDVATLGALQLIWSNQFASWLVVS